MRNLESHTLLERGVRVIAIPVLNILPTSWIKSMMRASSRDAREVVLYAGSAKALEAMYTRFHRGLFSRGFFHGLADFFWHHCVSQPRALRNRLSLVEYFFMRTLISFSERNDKIDVLCIGGGSARGVIHAVEKWKKSFGGKTIRVTNVDRDGSAIELSRALAQSKDLEHIFSWILSDFRDYLKESDSNSYNIIEMVGLLDYFSDTEALSFLPMIRKILTLHGVFIVANVHPNPEMPFVYKTGWPHMYYRTKDDFERLLGQAGFDMSKCESIVEPLGVHTVIAVHM